jgi:hypothetical protein
LFKRINKEIFFYGPDQSVFTEISMNAGAMTVGDKIIVVAVLVLAASLFFIVPRLLVTDGASIEVCSGKDVKGKFSLNQERQFDVMGPLGKTIIQIKGGRASIVSSPCPNKICVSMGSLGKEGGVLVCVPNEVVVRIGTDRADGLDAVTR